ncbi:MBL fold metallo-hydrolase [soil metagenome]
MAEDVGAWLPDHAIAGEFDGIWQLDLGFQGRRGIIAAYLIDRADDLLLIETGPASTIENLRTGLDAAGFSESDIAHVLVTHIHLDHAGAAGVLARENPGMTVHVHPFGVSHLVDPGKLVASAARIYGDQMDTLWGEILPIPPAQVRPFIDNEQLAFGGDLRVIFTPGHAWHHVAIHDQLTNSLFTGDVAGVRMSGQTYVCPPTPPPDLDPDAWSESIDRMQEARAGRICLTHFGVFEDVDSHFGELRSNLTRFVEIAEEFRQSNVDKVDLTGALLEQMQRDLGIIDSEVLESYELATPSYMASLGLTRLIRKRNESSDSGRR